jgi:hypothetical protein
MRPWRGWATATDPNRLLEEPAKAKAFFARFLEMKPGSPRAEQLRRTLSQLDGSPR